MSQMSPAPSVSVVQTAKLVIAAADIHSGGNIKTLVPAQGPNTWIMPIMLTVRYKFGTQDFTTLDVTISDPTQSIVFFDSGAFGASAADQLMVYGNFNYGNNKQLAFATFTNQPLSALAHSANNNGDGSVELFVSYVVVTLP